LRKSVCVAAVEKIPPRSIWSVPRNRFPIAARISFLDGLFFDLVNVGSAPKTNELAPGERDDFAVAAEEATKQAQHQER
jgi:hypothetical protein